MTHKEKKEQDKQEETFTFSRLVEESLEMWRNKVEAKDSFIKDINLEDYSTNLQA